MRAINRQGGKRQADNRREDRRNAVNDSGSMHQEGGLEGGIGTRVEGRYFKRHSDVKEEGEVGKGLHDDRGNCTIN